MYIKAIVTPKIKLILEISEIFRCCTKKSIILVQYFDSGFVKNKTN